MNLLTTFAGSMMEGFLPAGWDLAKLDACIDPEPSTITRRQKSWNKKFEPIPCANLHDFDVMLGHEIALAIKQARDEGRKLAMILPVGPMGMYKWAVYFLVMWNVSCDHVYGFNMDEWSDAEGNTLSSNDPAAFQYSMQEAFYGPLGTLTVPGKQRHFATRRTLHFYAGKIAELKSAGARVVCVYGIGRVCHIAFWEPHFAAEYSTDAEWKVQSHRFGAKLHPLTIEQNAITSFKSRYTLVPAFANTIGPGVFLMSDYCIGGADGILGRGMSWQAMSLWMTLRHEVTRWIPSTYMTTMPGKLFFLEELAGPLLPTCN